MTHAKNQGQGGSCWSVFTNDALDGAWALCTGTPGGIFCATNVGNLTYQLEVSQFAGLKPESPWNDPPRLWDR